MHKRNRGYVGEPGEALFGSVGEIALWIHRVAGSRAIQKLVDLGKSSLKEVKLLSRPRELVFSSPPTG